MNTGRNFLRDTLFLGILIILARSVTSSETTPATATNSISTTTSTPTPHIQPTTTETKFHMSFMQHLATTKAHLEQAHDAVHSPSYSAKTQSACTAQLKALAQELDDLEKKSKKEAPLATALLGPFEALSSLVHEDEQQEELLTIVHKTGTILESLLVLKTETPLPFEHIKTVDAGVQHNAKIIGQLS